MAGPAQQSARTFIVPPGEAQVQYSAASLAFKIQNLSLTPEGTLASVLGPTPYEPQRNRGYVAPTVVGSTVNFFSDTARGHGIYHTSLYAGQVGMLVARVDTRLFRHTGWNRGWEVIDVNLSSEGRAAYPDQFVVLNDKIIWTNGVDQARIIDPDGSVALLGFTHPPSAPSASGPMSKRSFQVGDEQYYPNHFSYSFQGRIGTVGDLLDGSEGAVLSGAWYYYAQYEDSYGNLSGTSSSSNPVRIETIQASPYNPNVASALWRGGFDLVGASEWVVYDASVDDLTRQFLVQTAGSAPENCTAIRLYRTPDTKHVDVVPRFLVRIPNNRSAMFPDNISDSELGSEMVETVPTPIFRNMCAHQGRLVIANVVGDPGIVRRSEIGFSGTFPRFEYIYPDSGGAEVTAVTSHNGVLLAFTETSVYSLEEFNAPRPLSQGIGCVAPRSIKALSNGLLVWLGRDGFYAMAGSQITRVSSGIERSLRSNVNRSRMRMSVAVYDSVSGEYRCAVPLAGNANNSLVYCFDGQNWRRHDLGIHVADWCRLDDWRQYLLTLGKEIDTSDVIVTATNTNIVADPSRTRNGSHWLEVFVMDRATRTYTPPTREIIYRSGWLRADATGLTPINVRTMYVGMIDAWNGDFEVRFYRNGSWSTFVAMSDVKAIGTDDGSGILTDIAGSAVIGTAKVHDPRVYWRQIPVGIENASSWAFEIRATYPTRLDIASFAFDVSVATAGNARSRIPLRND